jgi:hypothetical protein
MSSSNQSDLVISLVEVLLTDTNGIDPKQLTSVLLSHVPKESSELMPYFGCFTIEENFLCVVRAAPCVEKRCTCCGILKRVILKSAGYRRGLVA